MYTWICGAVRDEYDWHISCRGIFYCIMCAASVIGAAQREGNQNVVCFKAGNAAEHLCTVYCVGEIYVVQKLVE